MHMSLYVYLHKCASKIPVTCKFALVNINGHMLIPALLFSSTLE